MVIRRSLGAMLAMFIAMATVTGSAQRPGHDVAPGASPDASGTPVAFSCADIDIYLDQLDAVLAADGPFMEFVFSDEDFEDLGRAEAEDIIADGDEVIAALTAINAPGPYAPGHDGIVLFLQNMIDYVRFYTLDSSTVPDILAYDDAMSGIYRGEVAIAEACPEAIDDIGGYVFIDPETLEDDYGTNQ